jgi:hypothetical protein
MVTEPMRNLIEHQLVHRYRTALQAWYSSPHIADGATEIGLTQRAYCDAFIVNNYLPLSWKSTTSAPIDLDYDLSFAIASAE